MAKFAASTAPADLPDLDTRISQITQQVKERFSTLKHESQSIQRELERLSEQHERLTGKALIATESNGIERGGRTAGTQTRRSRKRTRKPSPTVEWLQETLAKKGMTVGQLKEAAEEANFS